jgi:exopolysaccharide production protein ExoQ
MPNASMHSLKTPTRSSGRIFDICAIVPILAIAYSIMLSPLLAVIFPSPVLGTSVAARLQSLMTPRPENKIFWPALIAISVALVIRHHSRLVRLSWPPHIISLLAYLAFCGASVLWAFRPELSFTRFLLQVMMIISIIPPAMLAARTADIMRGVFLCFAVASITNVLFVINQRPMFYDNGDILGYPGYFSFKGLLGECAAITFLLSLHEMLYPGVRRVAGIIVAVVAVSLIFPSYSKGSLAIAIIAPCLAAITLIVGKKMRLSPAIVLSPIPLCYQVLSHIPGVNLLSRISWHMYGNYTFSGRTVIWDFVNYELGRRPLLGWGFGSFWQVGPDGPSIVEAPGWIKAMPSGHSGYWDVMLELGYIGYPFLIIFIMATLHAIRRVADRDPHRAWLLLSLALFVIITNMIESVWMRGGDMQWLLFLIVVAEIGRYWGPLAPDYRSQRRPVLWAPIIPPRRPGAGLKHFSKLNH